MVIVKNIEVSPETALNDGTGKFSVRCRVFSDGDFATISRVFADLRHTALNAEIELAPDPGSSLTETAEGDWEGEVALPLHLEPGPYRVPVVAVDSRGEWGRGFGKITVAYRRVASDSGDEMFSALEKAADTGFSRGNTVKVLDDGPAAFSLYLSLIENAKHQINLQTYTLGGAQVGPKVMDALVKKADQGVSVNVILNSDTQIPVSPFSAIRLKLNQVLSEFSRDHRQTEAANRAARALSDKEVRARRGGVNLLMFSENPNRAEEEKALIPKIQDQWLEKLWEPRVRKKENDVKDEPWLSSFTGPGGLPALPFLDFAVHEKILVVDGSQAIVGGRNLEDPYYTYWKDLDLYLAGPVVHDIQVGFLYSFAEISCSKGEPCPQPEKLLAAEAAGDGLPVLFAESRPWSRNYRTLYALVSAIEAVRERFWAFSQYVLLPEGLLRDAILDAARRGVDVRIFTNSLETGQEVSLGAGYFATLNTLPALLEAGARVFCLKPENLQQKHTPYLHAKQYLFDDELCAVGSFNLSLRSCYVESENLLFVRDRDFCAGRAEAISEMQETNFDELSVESVEAQRTKNKSKVEMARYLDLLF
ncbi:MAG: phosphatidylserine/phosphatidylglycerophosphate/cardiolipin synthase family protein [Thermodesulfobacteriota bacterium]